MEIRKGIFENFGRHCRVAARWSNHGKFRKQQEARAVPDTENSKQSIEDDDCSLNYCFVKNDDVSIDQHGGGTVGWSSNERF